MKIIMLFVSLILAGCAPAPEDSDDQYGYHYTDVTPMGIKYRVDDGGAEIDPNVLDYYFSAVMNCTGKTFDPERLLVISTSEDVNLNMDAIVEGWSWPANGNNPARITLNIPPTERSFAFMISHELVHIMLDDFSHNNELFGLCGWREF